jgi:mannose-1-phosphate guanylyltransferase
MQNITKNIFVVSEKSHQHIILKQIKDFDRKKMIVEPCRKGTTNCVLLAARYIKNYFKGKKNNEKILFIHADHIFDNKINFISSIKGAFAVNVKGGIVIGGKKPTCAGTKYGYIETKKINNDLYKVNSFCEKPNQQLANKLYKKPNYF